jgi:hypothetical protein
MEKRGDELDVYCNICAGDRKHEVLFSKQKNYEDRDTDYHEVEQGLVVSCCGCQHWTFLTRWWNSSERFITQYPPKTVRKKPDWLWRLAWTDVAEPGTAPDRTKSAFLTEIYSALGAGCTRLAIMGIRALLEHIIIEKVNDQGSFQQNLAAFEAQGFISKVHGKTLALVLEAGHASIHRAYDAPLDDVLLCLDVTELLIASVFIHPGSAAAMKLPERSRRAKNVARRPGPIIT